MHNNDDKDVPVVSNEKPNETGDEENQSFDKGEEFSLVIAIPKKEDLVAFALDPILGKKKVTHLLDLCSEFEIEPEFAVISWPYSDGTETILTEGYNGILILETAQEDTDTRLTLTKIMDQICEYKINFEKACIGYRIRDDVRIVYIFEESTQ